MIKTYTRYSAVDAELLCIT